MSAGTQEEAPGSGPTVLRILLGAQLRRLREAKAITLENQSPKNSPIPWHPGAVKYFAEKGVKI